MEDYIFIDLLTSEESEILFNYRFITLDINNILRWIDRDNFIAAVSKFNEEGKWKDLSNYHHLDSLVKLLNS